MSDEDEYEDDFDSNDQPFEYETEWNGTEIGDDVVPFKSQNAVLMSPSKIVSLYNGSVEETKQRERQAARIKWIALNIKLVQESFVLFEQFPMTKLDAFNRALGRGRSIANVGCQVNADWQMKSVQTEDVMMKEAATSFLDEKKNNAEKSLLKFLRRVSPAMETLILENLPLGFFDKLVEHQKELGKLFSSFKLLEWKNSIISNRAVVSVSFSPAHPFLLSVAYGPDPISLVNGVVCIWQISSNQLPQKVMICDGCPTCCTFDPNRGQVVIAGLKEGSIVLWDLKEVFSLSHFKRPTFSTDANSVHVAGIVDLKTLASDSASHSFQLVSLDESGVVCIWTVIELSTGDLSDLYLSPDGKIRLIPVNIFSMGTNACVATRFSIGSNDVSELFACIGNIKRVSRLGATVVPATYSAIPSSFLSTSHVRNMFDTNIATCIQFHSIFSKFFLVGYKSGIVCLFSVDDSEALQTWNVSKNEIVSLSWSFFRPSLFLTMDKEYLFVFDLLSTNFSPLASCRILEGNNSNHLSGFSLSSALLQTLKVSLCALSSKLGVVSVYLFQPGFATISTVEMELLRNKLT